MIVERRTARKMNAMAARHVGRVAGRGLSTAQIWRSKIANPRMKNSNRPLVLQRLTPLSVLLALSILGACGGVTDEITDETDELDACEPSETRCAGPRVLETCGEDGAWRGLFEACDASCVTMGDTAASCRPDCAAGVLECVDAKRYRTCSEVGAWSEPVSCGDSACYNNVCQGVCLPDSHQCDTDGHSEICDGTGTWRKSEGCKADDELLCNKSTGLCENNEQYEVGHISSDDGSVFQASDTDLLATPVLIDEDAEVEFLGVLTGETIPKFTGVKLAIYDDDGGKPGARIAATSTFDVLKNHTNPRSVPGSVKLTGGKIYWLAVKLLMGSENADLYTFSTPGQTSYWAADSAGGGPVSPFPAGVAMTNTTIGVYVKLRGYWH